MIKIRALGARELKQVLRLLERVQESDFAYPVLQKFRQLYLPILRISQGLPAQLQFMPAVYVAVSRNQVLGVICLSADGQKRNRWKIDQVIVDPDEASAYDIGTQLVNYVINRYGGEGVQTFLAHVDTRFEDALALFKSCGFRHGSRLHTFQLTQLDSMALDVGNIKGIREAAYGDWLKLQQLFSDHLPVELRHSLEPVRADFHRPFFQWLLEKCQGQFQKRWVVEDTARDVLLGSVELASADFKRFHLSVVSSPGWSEGEQTLLHFALQQVLKMTRQGTVLVTLYDFQKTLLQHLEAEQTQRTATAELLIKDYWIRNQKPAQPVTSPILLFSGKTSPACLQPKQ